MGFWLLEAEAPISVLSFGTQTIINCSIQLILGHKFVIWPGPKTQASWFPLMATRRTKYAFGNTHP